MEIKRYFLTRGDNTRRKEKMVNIEYIVITSSKYKGFSALKNRNTIEKIKYNKEKEFSCHYIIDTNGEILSIIPDNEMAICTKDYNFDSKSISIMLCINEKGKYERKELLALKNLLNKLSKKYNINKENIVYEYNVNFSRRPTILVEEPILLNEIIYK